MNLYELFDTATDNLTPLPDLAPAAERIVRRRRIATRSFSAACAAALVIGVGTLTLHPDNGMPADIGVGGPCSSASASPVGTPDPGYSLNPTSKAGGGTAPDGFTATAAAATFPQQAAETLSELWPVSCSTVVSAGAIYPATSVERYQAYEVVTGGGSFPLVLRFDQGPQALALRHTCSAGNPDCESGTLDSGDPFTASFVDGYGLLTFPANGTEVTLMEFDPSSDAITLPQLVEMGNSAEMLDLVALAVEDEIPADNGITPSGLAAQASAVRSQSAN